MSGARWSVEMKIHVEEPNKRYEQATQEMTIFLTDEQAGLVRQAILSTLAQSKTMVALAEVAK